MNTLLASRGSRFARLSRVAAAVAFCASGAGCSRDERGATSLRVLAAASLGDVVGELAAGSGEEEEVSAGASGALRRQIELGTGCDVFISADPLHVDALIASGLLLGDTRTVLARNRLVVVFHEGQSTDAVARLMSPQCRRIAIGNPEYVPAGRYARQALEAAGVWEELQGKLVLTDDVRQAAAHVALGTVDAAVVYQSDAVQLEKCVAAELPDAAHQPIMYVGAVHRAAADPDRASAFLRRIAADEAAAIWRKHGFIPVVGGSP